MKITVHHGLLVIAKDLEFVEKTMLEFCRNQALKNAILKSVDLLQIGEYEQIKAVIDDKKRMVLDASNFGIPQERKRVFLIGVRLWCYNFNPCPSICLG